MQVTRAGTHQNITRRVGASARIMVAVFLCACMTKEACAEKAFVFFDGNDIHSFCQSRPESARILARAWADAAAVHDMKPESCIPRNATAEQISDTFCKYLSSTPETRHLPASTLFQVATSEAWACRKVVVDRCTGKEVIPGVPAGECTPINRWIHITVADFLESHPEYNRDGALYPLLNEEVKRLQETAPNPFAATLLEDAHATIMRRAAKSD